jgi:hypothetical protein
MTQKVVSRKSKQGSRKVVSRKSKQGSRKSKQGSRKVVSRKSKQGSRKVVSRKPKQGSRKVVSRKPKQGSRKVVCKDDEEINPETQKCRKKCKEGQERDQNTKRCRKSKCSKKPKKSVSKKPINENKTQESYRILQKQYFLRDDKYQTSIKFIEDDIEDEIDANDTDEIVNQKLTRKYRKNVDNLNFVLNSLVLSSGKTSSKKKPLVGEDVEPDELMYYQEDPLLDFTIIGRFVASCRITDRDTLEQIKNAHSSIWVLNKLLKSKKFSKLIRKELNKVLVNFVSYFEEYFIKMNATRDYINEIIELRNNLGDPISQSNFFKTKEGKQLEKALVNFTNELPKKLVNSAMEYNDEVEDDDNAYMFSTNMLLQLKENLKEVNTTLKSRPKKHIGPLKWIEDNAISSSKVLQFLNPSVEHDEYDVYDENDFSWNQYHHQPQNLVRLMKKNKRKM